jgi:hypothetical protein
LRKIFDDKIVLSEGNPGKEEMSFKNDLNAGLIALRDEPYFKDIQLYSDWETQPVSYTKNTK